jgi:adenylate kinase
MVIIVTGTPGTGKTTIARLIAKKYKLKYIDTNRIIKLNKLILRYDKKKQTNIVDHKKLAKILVGMIRKNNNLVIDGHLSHYIPKKYVNLCVITKCDIKILMKRLEKRKYSTEKIRENLDCEIFDVILNEAIEMRHNIYVIDTSDKKSVELPSKSSFSS